MKTAKRFACLLVSALMLVPSAWAREAIVSSMRGRVEVQAPGSSVWRPARAKMLLRDGEKIRTLRGARATLIFEDGSRTDVYPGTTLTLAKLSLPVNLAQLGGRTRNRVRKIIGKGFTLRTPTAVCSVRGTDFTVGVSEGGDTHLQVDDGTVHGIKLATFEEEDVPAGHSQTFTADNSPLAPQETQGSERPEASRLKEMAKKEVGLDMTRDEIQAAAAEELKLAEYQEGKSLIDVNGNRVRLEEYILRRPKDVDPADRDKAFKFVVLDTRASRFDYFTYKGVFNKALPDDLSVALRDAAGRKLGSEPEYYLVSYEMDQSNLTDAIKDMADGGHLVEVTYDGTAYTLKAHSVASDGSAGPPAPGDVNVTQSGSANGQIYDPVADVYKDPGAGLDGVYDPTDDSFKTMKAGDTLWRTVFNRYGHLMGPSAVLAKLTLNDVPSGTLTQPWFQYYSAKTGVTNIATLESYNNAGVGSAGTLTVGGKTLTLIGDQNIGDASFKYLNGKYGVDVSFPSGADQLHTRITTYYPKSNSDIPYEQYDTYIISDEGKIAPTSAFANATSGKTFKEQLLSWNYEQVTRSSSFGDTIDLVVEPRILIDSGLIK